MIVTIDGPAGAGKSSIARQVADRLAFDFLDTGAMYRAVTLGCLRAGIDFDDVDALEQFAGCLELRWDDQRIFLNGEDVSEEIRQPEVSAAIGRIADLLPLRTRLSEMQRQVAEGKDIVTEGRDQGAEVFPDAECKVFLTASPQTRARRRQLQLSETGVDLSIDEILDAQNRRDLEDTTRDVGRLRAADDAIVVNTDCLSSDEVLQAVLEIIHGVLESRTSKTAS
ncbi:(d)CMP kinase [Crateriforma conspicua]|uniref:Cytidylate kinase n=1 Tax=Crateriforma conspicua TaxID=2527996 RepID=A0A5C6FX73_9PLAN|nr:(d)CMP kinase [Crateriforma conspicua]QDV63747.1 Cytidylate kinase [Crateriforma conspicua]TWU66934.1 Cytidylate kinase [Crateriforma conspicua]